jgi:hypothetical protein
MGMEKTTTRVVLVAALAVGLLGLNASPAAATQTITPSSWNFGTLSVGATSAPKSFTLTVACTPMGDTFPCYYQDSLAPVISATGDFTVVSQDCPASMSGGPSDANDSCTIVVTFAPTATGTRSGSLQTGGPSAALTGFAPVPPVTTQTGPTPTTPTTPTTRKKKCKKHRSAAAAKRRCKKAH